MFGFSLYWLPGICLCLYGILVILLGVCNPAPSQSGLEPSVTNKLFISLLHGFIPLQLLALMNFFKTPVRLFWFFDSRRILYSSATGFFYGKIFDICLKLYILTKTPLASLPFLTYLSILSGLRALVVTSTDLLLEEEDGDPPVPWEKIVLALKCLFCCKQKQDMTEEKEPEAPKQGMTEKVMNVLKHQLTYLAHFPLFLPNSLFNILSMVQILIWCEKEGYLCMFGVFIVFSMFTLLIISMLHTTDIPLMTK